LYYFIIITLEYPKKKTIWLG